MKPTAPRVTVIIPAYRAQRTLPRVIAALARQIDPARHEVLVVESGGPGGSLAAGQRLGAERPWLSLIGLDDRAYPGRARNAGAAVARGDLLVFLDADAVPGPGWLEALERALTPDRAAVAGAILNGTPASRWGTAEYWLEFAEWRPGRTGPIEHAASCNLLVRRSAFEASGGFPCDLRAGEDTVLTRGFALRGELAFAPDACVRHLNRTSPREVLRNQRLLGVAWPEVCRRVDMPGGALATPRRLPLALAGRAWAILKQTREPPLRVRATLAHAPELLLGLLAWASGIASGSARDPDKLPERLGAPRRDDR